MSDIPCYSYPADFPPKFVKFNDRFPWVYTGIIEHARQLKATGRYTCIGIRYLFEHERYSEAARLHRAEVSIEYAIDNNTAPWYARLIEAREPDLAGFFRMRRMRDEIEKPDASQEVMEFD